MPHAHTEQTPVSVGKSWHRFRQAFGGRHLGGACGSAHAGLESPDFNALPPKSQRNQPTRRGRRAIGILGPRGRMIHLRRSRGLRRLDRLANKSKRWRPPFHERGPDRHAHPLHPAPISARQGFRRRRTARHLPGVPLYRVYRVYLFGHRPHTAPAPPDSRLPIPGASRPGPRPTPHGKRDADRRDRAE